MMEKRVSVAQIIDWINKTIIGVANISLLLITILVTLEVFSRKLFGVSFTIVTAMTGVGFAWLVFLAIIIITQKNEHIAVNYFFGKIPKKFQKYVAIFNRLVMLAFSIFMVIASYQLTVSVVDTTIPVLGVSRSWLYSSMIFSFLFSSIYLILQTITIAKEGQLGGEENDLDYDL